MASYLENALDILKGLPNDIQRNYQLIASLDTKAVELKHRLELDEKEALKLAALHPPNETSQVNPRLLDLLKSVRMGHEQLYAVQLEKVQVAEQCEFVVTAYQQRIQSDIDSFGEELGDAAPNAVGGYLKSNSAEQARKKHKVELEAVSSEESEEEDDGLSITDAFGGSEAAVGSQQAELYCVCQQVSFGEMVGCESKNCPYQWFHYKCVGIKTAPKGKWYCDHCTSKMR
jgi:hypothetical protein